MKYIVVIDVHMSFDQDNYHHKSMSSKSPFAV